MSGAMRKMGVYLGLLEDADGHYADGPYAEADAGYDEPTRATPLQPARQPARPVADLSERRRQPAPRPAPAAMPLSRITTLHPRTYNDARVVGENYRDGIPVIMNLSEMADAEAKRLVDFAAGLVFSIHGTIERVTNKVFLLTPPDVTVAAEEKARLVEGGFFNQS
ncbi:MAG: cell division protein SepF [Marmoricola sp.]